VAGIPCQPFSIERVGRQKGMADYRGARLWTRTAELFAAAGAQVVVVENVDEAVKAAGTEGAAIFAAHGFPCFHCQTVAASDYGSAQVRRRMWATYSRRPLTWEPAGPAPGPRPVRDFLLKTEEFEEEAWDAGEARALRGTLEPCYLGGRHLRMLIEKRVHEESNFGLAAVPVWQDLPVGAFTRNYWKGGGSAPLLVDRCLGCGYQVEPHEDWLYLTDDDCDEEDLRFPAHLVCGACREDLYSDLGDLTPGTMHDWLVERWAAGATSVRRFHPREIARMFGLPDVWPLPEKPGPATRLLGNSLHVDTAVAVLQGVEAAMLGQTVQHLALAI